MTNTKKKLISSTKGGKSVWRDDAEFRLRNKKWLRYSSNIARRILAIITDRKDLNQKILAGKIGVKPQYINKVVRGRENLSLETISKISEALGVELIQFPTYKYSLTKKPDTNLPIGFIENGSQQPMPITGIQTINAYGFTNDIFSIASIATA